MRENVASTGCVLVQYIADHLCEISLAALLQSASPDDDDGENCEDVTPEENDTNLSFLTGQSIEGMSGDISFAAPSPPLVGINSEGLLEEAQGITANSIDGLSPEFVLQ